MNPEKAYSSVKAMVEYEDREGGLAHFTVQVDVHMFIPNGRVFDSVEDGAALHLMASDSLQMEIQEKFGINPSGLYGQVTREIKPIDLQKGN